MIVILQYVSLWSSLCIQFQKEESEQTFPREEDPVASCVPHCYTQDVSLACCLSPGAYTIVPSTYQPDCSASFTLSLARRIHRLALLLRLNLVIRWCDHTADSISFRYCYCILCLFQESGEKPGEAGKSHSGGQFIDNSATPADKSLFHQYDEFLENV